MKRFIFVTMVLALLMVGRCDMTPDRRDQLLDTGGGLAQPRLEREGLTSDQASQVVDASKSIVRDATDGGDFDWTRLIDVAIIAGGIWGGRNYTRKKALERKTDAPPKA
ncbi:MAG: hypothetical protein GY937_20095 [bacterium]|nr:hypothetical protein [bacterium]